MINADEPVHFISPTEPAALRAIGTVSSAVERKGCDVISVLPEVRIGWQRKTWLDLVISLEDGRLADSIPKMDTGIRIVVIEGPTPEFGEDGRMVVRSKSKRADGKSKNSPKRGYVALRYTRESLLGVKLSMRWWHGLEVVRTDDLADTIRHVQRTALYFSKQHHQGLAGQAREGIGSGKRDDWGRMESREQQRHTQKVNFLRALGLGVKTAEALLQVSGGRIPLAWEWGKEDFESVPNIGRTTSERLMRFFE